MNALMQKIKTDLPLVVIGILAVLPIPRVVLHDLQAVSFDSLLYKLLAVVPFMAWIGVAVLRKTKRPFADFLTLGLAFGVLLALTHQLLWDVAWGGNLPRLEGGLSGQLSPAVEAAILRTASVISSLMTGLMTGLAAGLVAFGATKLRKSKKS